MGPTGLSHCQPSSDRGLIIQGRSLGQFVERVSDSLFETVHPISAEGLIEIFQPADQIQNFRQLGSTGGCAKMCAATKGTILINHAIAGGGVQHRARSRRI
jgi:hypothetical protein